MPSTRKNPSGTTSAPATSSKRNIRTTKPAAATKQPKRSPSPSTIERQLHAAGKTLLLAASKSTLIELKALLKKKEHPIWYQDEETGWSALHFAAERGEPEVVAALLRAGAVWNSVDKLGLTAGDAALSINDEESYKLIRDEGLRSEMLLHAMRAMGGHDQDQDMDEDEKEETKGPAVGPSSTATTSDPTISSTTTSNSLSNTLTLKSHDLTSSGSNLTFLSTPLHFSTGEDGLERVLDEDGNGVMMGWETPLMREHVRWMCAAHPEGREEGRGLRILNVGFGLGIIDNMFQLLNPPPLLHTIIEAHPSVLSHIRTPSVSFHTKPNVRIMEGRWQDWLDLGKPEGVGELLEGTGGEGFDVIFVDTFAEGYEDLKAFFEFLPDLLNGPDAVFSFWNGLGATNALIYDVASNLAEMHLDAVGLTTTWHDVDVPDATAEVTWKDVKRKYWTLPVYRLPVARMTM